jgi:RNA polymerase sigma-70 factor (ECF subfamily)
MGSSPKPDLAALLDRYERPLVRYAVSIVGDLESARDAVQETFIRLSRLLPDELEYAGPDDSTDIHTSSLDFSNEKHVEAWLFYRLPAPVDRSSA